MSERESLLTAAIAGASGLVGGACLERMLASSAFGSVVTVSRAPLPRRSPKLQQIVTPFDQLGNVPLEVRLDVALCCLGTTARAAASATRARKVDLDYVVAFATWCRRHGASGFVVVSSMGADPRSMFASTRGCPSSRWTSTGRHCCLASAGRYGRANESRPSP